MCHLSVPSCSAHGPHSCQDPARGPDALLETPQDSVSWETPQGPLLQPPTGTHLYAHPPGRGVHCSSAFYRLLGNPTSSSKTHPLFPPLEPSQTTPSPAPTVAHSTGPPEHMPPPHPNVSASSAVFPSNVPSRGTGRTASTCQFTRRLQALFLNEALSSSFFGVSGRRATTAATPGGPPSWSPGAELRPLGESGFSFLPQPSCSRPRSLPTRAPQSFSGRLGQGRVAPDPPPQATPFATPHYPPRPVEAPPVRAPPGTSDHLPPRSPLPSPSGIPLCG